MENILEKKKFISNDSKHEKNRRFSRRFFFLTNPRNTQLKQLPILKS